jgi:hypothetical protein
MACPKCGSKNVHESNTVHNTHTGAHLGLHQLKHSGMMSHPLGIVALVGIGIVCKGVEMLAKKHRCGSCRHKY